jgi:hypothetical protein
VDFAPPLVDVRPAFADVRDGLDLVNRRLGRLELVALVDDRARLRKTLTQLARARIGPFLAMPESPEGSSRHGADGSR